MVCVNRNVLPPVINIRDDYVIILPIGNSERTGGRWWGHVYGRFFSLPAGSCAPVKKVLLELKETWFNKDLNASGDQCLKDGKKSGLGYFGS